MDKNNLKKCCVCKEHKSLDEFHRDRTGSKGVSSKCIPCALAYKSDWQRRLGLRRRAEYKKKSYILSKLRDKIPFSYGKKSKLLGFWKVNSNKKKNGLYLKWFKETHKCVCCGIRIPDVLQFHHRDPKTKLFEINLNYIGGLPLSVIIDEIKKCDLLCANCHILAHKRARKKTKVC